MMKNGKKFKKLWNYNKRYDVCLFEFWEEKRKNTGLKK